MSCIRLVVRKFDNNNAGRKEIIVRKVSPSTWAGNVVLTRNNTKVKVFDASTGGTEITFNGTDNKFANSSLPESLWVEGYTGSSSMRDVALELGLENTPPAYKDKAKFTVLWVVVTTDHSGSLEMDNAGRDLYSSMVVPPPNYALGHHLFRRITPYVPEAGFPGRASEFIGSVSPSALSYARAVLGHEYWH